MNHLNSKALLRWIGIAITTGLLMGTNVVQAGETAKAVAQAEKSAKPAAAKKKANSAKKKEQAVAGGCEMNAKKWRDGASCRTTCNEKGTLCDMRLCAKGTWKHYGSCFGPRAVAANCPAPCE